MDFRVPIRILFELLSRTRARDARPAQARTHVWNALFGGAVLVLVFLAQLGNLQVEQELPCSFLCRQRATPPAGGSFLYLDRFRGRGSRSDRQLVVEAQST